MTGVETIARMWFEHFQNFQNQSPKAAQVSR